MLEVKHLTKQYGSLQAVQDISFTVPDGQILGFLGPNGAGKSTTMNIITGYLSSTSGTVTVDGHEILAQPMEAKRRIGYLPEQPPLYPDMTVEEYLDFMYRLKKVTEPKQEHIAAICKLVGIAEVYGRLIKNLSKGYRQRVGLAQALLGNPGLLILDEPTVGLDPAQIIEMRGVIKQLGEQHTVILSSHILSEIQAVCDRVIVIDKGKLLADDTPEALSRTLGADHSLTVRIGGPKEPVLNLLQGLPGVERAVYTGEKDDGSIEYTVDTAKGADVRRELFRRLADRDWPLLWLSVNQLSLEDIFLRLTGEPPAPEHPRQTKKKQRAAKGGDAS